MATTLYKIKALYRHMGRAEKKIADCILEKPQDMISLSIAELAKRCDCGEATIVRFSRRIGLGGFQELKIAVAQELKSAPMVDILPEDSCLNIFEKRISEIAAALESTRYSLSDEEMEKAAKAIMHARRVVILGLGNSASIALDAQHKFLRAGLDATACSDNHMQTIIASHLKEGDVCLGVSHSGASSDIVEALKIAGRQGATTVCITNQGVSPITRVSDIKLFTSAEETKYMVLALSSRLAQLAIIDAIYAYIVYHSDADAINAINETERALESKKMK